VNAGGGINGHPVKVIVGDDADDPTQGLQVAKQLIQQDHVIALVGVLSTTDDSWAKYADSMGVPVIGGDPTYTEFSTDPNFFPIGAGLLVTNYAALKLSAQHGATKIGFMYCAEVPICAQGAALAKVIAPIAGVQVTYAGKFSATATDYTAPCLALKSAGVDAVWYASNPSADVAISADCAQQGLSALHLGVGDTLSDVFLQAPAMSGMVAASPTYPWFLDSSPAAKAYRDALAKYTNGIIGTSLDNAVNTVWIGGELFEAAAKAANIGPNSTSADVKKGLYSLKGETLGGLTPPLTFSEGKATQLNCWYTIGIANGQFTAPNGSNYQCASPAAVAAIEKAAA
jgi:branched-chain amino acid transport system substrate-binding protein